MSYRIRSSKRPGIIAFLIAALLMAACGAQSLGSGNWPGISAENDTIFLAYGPSVVAVDIANQRETWRYTPSGKAGSILAAPAIDNGTIYFADYGASQGTFTPGVVASVYAVDSEDISGNQPRELWVAEGVATDRVVAPVLAADGKLFIGTSNNQVIALDAGNYNELWRNDVGHSIWGKPAFVGGSVIVTSLDKHVYSFDADSGSTKWEVELDGSVAAAPLVVDDTIYVATFANKLHALDVSSGSERWVTEATNWIWQAPAYANGMLYFGDASGKVFAVNASSGTIEWQIETDGAVESGIGVHNGTLFVPVVNGVSSQEQTGQLLALSAENGNIIWQNELDMAVFVRPLVVDEELVILVSELPANGIGEFELRTYNPETGQQGWRYVPAE